MTIVPAWRRVLATLLVAALVAAAFAPRPRGVALGKRSDLWSPAAEMLVLSRDGLRASVRTADVPTAGRPAVAMSAGWLAPALRGHASPPITILPPHWGATHLQI
jgi:hypothetical protein